jgi:hypothetical protein
VRGAPVSSTLAGVALAALLVFALFLAGCGSGSSPATSATTRPATTPAPNGPSSSERAAAVSACKHAVAGQGTLNAEVKAKLDALCDKAGTSNEAEIKKDARAVCEEVIAKSGVPAGPTREEALKACQSS